MTKILFIMFQGAGTNLKTWNEYTKSKFLDRLKKLGDIYTYQDKVNNIWHYDMKDKEHTDFDSNIDFNIYWGKIWWINKKIIYILSTRSNGSCITKSKPTFLFMTESTTTWFIRCRHYYLLYKIRYYFNLKNNNF